MTRAACILAFALPCAATAQAPATHAAPPTSTASAPATSAASAPTAPAASTSPAQDQTASAALTAPDTVLIRSATATLTRGDYDLELTRLPADARGGFGTNPARVNALLNRMLVTKTMAADARKAGIEKQPEAQRRIEAETERVLAALYIEKIEREAGAAFDARPGIEAAARERYIVDADKYRTPEFITVTHILFETSNRDREAALKLAQDARAKVLAGADMNALATEISEDPSAKRNGGKVPLFAKDKMDSAFAAAAFALQKPGDISEPVLSRYGYHIIRLDGRVPSALRPYAEVRKEIIADMRRQYVDQQRSERITAVRNDPTIVVNEPAVEALVVRIDQEQYSDMLEKAAAQAFSGSDEKSGAAPGAGAGSPAPK